ncbi:MAG: primosomal protein N' (replication factor Y) - superfamily II helicase [Rhodobacterales bacterium]
MPPEKAELLEEHRFPCAQCGADYRFAPGEGALHCDHCGHRQQIAPPGPWSGALKELDFNAALARNLPPSETEVTRVSNCNSCGAQVEFDPAVHALECPFCASPLVADTGTHRHIKPRAVLPFALDEQAARKAMNDWLGKLWFAPNGLQDYARKGRRMTGIYVPYWTFDADTQSRYSGQRGTVYYETVTVMRDGKPVRTQVPRIRWRAVSGRVQRWFDDVLVLAATSLPRRYTEGLEPWDLSALQSYRPEFLAGFRAEGYTVDLEAGFSIAREKMDRVIERDVRFDIGGDQQRIHTVDTQVSNVTFKHILLPVWLAAYKYRGQSYRFVVNGATGRVQGERPWSAWKIAFAIILGALIAGAVGFGLALNEGLM